TIFITGSNSIYSILRTGPCSWISKLWYRPFSMRYGERLRRTEGKQEPKKKKGQGFMKKTLITGAAGFLGSHLCDRFIAEGHHVIGMDNLITGDLRNIEHLFHLKRFEFYNHDVSTFVHVPGRMDNILHFASPASPIDYLKIPIETLKVGSLGTLNLLGLAKDHKARILVASTSEVYGDPLVHPQSEDYFGNVSPIGPRGVYDEANA